MKHLIESLTGNIGLGRESYNKQFLKKIFGSKDSDFFERLCGYIGIRYSIKLRNRVLAIAREFESDAVVPKWLDYTINSVSMNIDTSQDKFPLDLADMTLDEGLFVIELDCFKDVYKELDKMFNKYTTTFFDIYEDKRLQYRYYSWKDCTIALDTI